MAEEPGSGRIHPGSRRRFTLVLFVASVLYTSAAVLIDNHAVQVPLVRLLNDGTLFPGDPFAAALAGYPSDVWTAVAGLARLFPVAPLLLVLFLLLRLLVLYAAGRLALAFAPDSELAPIASMALFAFAVRPLLGQGTIVERYFEQTGLAVALVLLAVAAFHESRARAWAVWTGLASNASVMYGTFALVYFGAVLVVDGDYRRDWRRWARSGLLLFVLCLRPMVLLMRSQQHPLRDATTWLAAGRLRSVWHLYLREWDPGAFVKAGVLLALLLLFMLLGGAARPRLRRHAIVWSAVAASWLGLAYVAAYVVVTPSILLAQPARATDLWVCFAAVAITATGASTLEDVFRGDASGLQVRGGVALALTPFLLWRYGDWPALAILVAALVVPAAFKLILDGGKPRRLAVVLVVWVCFAGVYRFSLRAAARGLEGAVLVRPEGCVEDIAAWAKADTPRDAVFLVNPADDLDWNAFRALSDRAIVTSWEEGTAINWAPNFAEEWERRLRLLGFDLRADVEDAGEALHARYLELDDDAVARIRAQVPLRYWVVPSEHSTRYAAAIRRCGVKILDLGAGLPSGSRRILTEGERSPDTSGLATSDDHAEAGD